MSPPKQQPSNRAVGGVLFAFFAVFLAFSSYTAYMMVILPRNMVKEADRWQETPCVIREITVQSHTSSTRGAGTGSTYRSNTSYSPKVRFEYSFKGQSYTGDKFWLGGTLFNDKQDVEEIIATYKESEQAVCYVNPSDPSQAVVSRILYDKDYTGWLWLVVFIMFGVLGCLFSLWLAFIAKPSDSGVVTIEPNFSPSGGVLAVWGLALVWNGIVGLIFYLGVQGNMPVSARLLVGFFGLIGLLIVVGACFKTYDAIYPPPPGMEGKKVG